MNIKPSLGIFFILIVSFAIVAPAVSAESNTLTKPDFQQQSFAKTVDYFDYVRAYATLAGLPTPANFDQWHANMYMAYINTSGLQLLYAGLEDITTDGSAYLRMPAQSFLMHYKTNENSRDVILASTFLMLMAFTDTENSRYPNSPDIGDNLYASFSLGYDLSSLGVNLPSLNSKTEIIPLASSEDNLQWTWGMKYTNLTALWWKTWIDPNDPHFENSLPFAVTAYDELTFKYTLTIDPANNKATLTENHVIGRMRDLIIGQGLIWIHMNNTGTYGPLGRQLSDQTIYAYLDKNQIKMSIVDYQASVLADHTTYSSTTTGQNVADTDAIVSDTTINTYTDDGEKVSSTDFGAKPTYKLYNYTSDPTETTAETYDAITRTANATGFANNKSLFTPQINLMKFLPLVVYHMYPELYEKAQNTISDMSNANYFFLTAYPQYSGFRTEHDPVFTVYMNSASATSTQPQTNAKIIFLVLIAVAVIAVIAVALTITRKRKP